MKGRGYDAYGVDPLVNGFLKDQNFPFLFDLVLGVEVIEHLPNMWEELCDGGGIKMTRRM